MTTLLYISHSSKLTEEQKLDIDTSVTDGRISILSKRFDTLKFSKVRFEQLARDPNARTKVYHKKTVDEARSALQAEIMGIIEDVERIPQPYCKSVDLDFRISGPAPYSHLDMKHPVGSLILKKQNSPSTLQESSLNMGK